MRQTFEIIPAIDILGGKCVRLTKGDFNKVEEFSQDPIEVAKKWIELGAKRLHVIDLDGAREGYPVNLNVITKITKGSSVKVQVGGGIRTYKAISDYLNNGASYVILGTKAFLDKLFLKETINLYQEKLILALDLKNNKIALSGWQETIELSISSLSKELTNVKQVIYTDILQDGTLRGPNLGSIEEVLNSFKSNIIISGGISTTNDILSIIRLKKEKYPNISGVILGKSLYKGTINLTSAIEATEKELRSM